MLELGLIAALFLLGVIYHRVIFKDIGGIDKGWFEFRFFNMHKYSKQTDVALSTLLGKYRAGLVQAELDPEGNKIIFSDGSIIRCTLRYYEYAVLENYINTDEFNNTRCSTKLFREVQELEKELKNNKSEVLL